MAQVLLALAAVGLVIHFFHVEADSGLPRLVPFILGGFVLHSLMPFSWRLPFLFAINLGAIFFLLGPLDGGLLISMGLVLFGIANLALPVGYRAGSALAMGALLAALRAEWLPFTSGRAILPILGAMFMFRLVLYLYEMQFEKQPAGFWKKINYFFLLPNLVFVIFPVIDYQTFVRGYYARPAFETYRKGALMMANGVFHLLLYRLIYYYLLPAPSEVQDTFSLLQFMIASYALIVRLAGIFHFSVGVICLFGFNLPHAFEHYFFANSFSDLWRRINIYWRDFVTKVFYYPIYFRLKRYGAVRGMVLAVLVVFFINWFLHGYQWFWIRGAFPLTVQDTVFWGVLGVLVAINSARQARRRPGQPAGKGFSLRRAWRQSLSVLAVFGMMCILWSFWTSSSPGEWLAMVGRGRPASLHEAVLPVLGFLLLGGLGVAIQYLDLRYRQNRLLLSPSPRRTFWLATAGLGALALFGQPQVNQQLEAQLGADFEPVLYAKLNAFDREQLYKGYYETLMAGSNLSSRMWEMEQARPDDWKSLNELGLRLGRDDILLKELAPNKDVEFKGGRFITNQHGLRDREYEKEKPAHALRFALLGGSIEMGTGVDNGQTYENLTEDALNAAGLMGEGRAVEILNFAIAGNHLFQNVAMCEWKAASFQPDVVVYPAHSNEAHRILSSLYRDYNRGRELSYPFLKELIVQAGVTYGDAESEFIAKLKPYESEIIAWGYRRIRECAESIQALPLWLYVPALDDNEAPGEAAALEAAARAQGFFTLSLQGCYGTKNLESLKIAPWDFHPNARGHALIAERWLEELAKDVRLLQALRER
jgi:D-alanyl-lipoteichoic acid acyltransferase DltB (MBOAT superfamily)